MNCYVDIQIFQQVIYIQQHMALAVKINDFVL